MYILICSRISEKKVTSIQHQCWLKYFYTMTEISYGRWKINNTKNTAFQDVAPGDVTDIYVIRRFCRTSCSPCSLAWWGRQQLPLILLYICTTLHGVITGKTFIIGCENLVYCGRYVRSTSFCCQPTALHIQIIVPTSLYSRCVKWKNSWMLYDYFGNPTCSLCTVIKDDTFHKYNAIVRNAIKITEANMGKVRHEITMAGYEIAVF